MSVTYRNEQDGRTVTRPNEDEWLEASKVWLRVDEPGPEVPSKEQEGSKD